MREQSQLADNPLGYSSSHCPCPGEPRRSVLHRPQRSCLWQTKTLVPSGQTAQIQQQDVGQEWQVYPQAEHPSSQPAPSTQDSLHHLWSYPTVCPHKELSILCTKAPPDKAKEGSTSSHPLSQLVTSQGGQQNLLLAEKSLCTLPIHSVTQRPGQNQDSISLIIKKRTCLEILLEEG